MPSALLLSLSHFFFFHSCSSLKLPLSPPPLAPFLVSLVKEKAQSWSQRGPETRSRPSSGSSARRRRSSSAVRAAFFLLFLPSSLMQRNDGSNVFFELSRLPLCFPLSPSLAFSASSLRLEVALCDQEARRAGESRGEGREREAQSAIPLAGGRPDERASDGDRALVSLPFSLSLSSLISTPTTTTETPRPSSHHFLSLPLSLSLPPSLPTPPLSEKNP